MPDVAKIQDFFHRVEGVASAATAAERAVARAIAHKFRPIELLQPDEMTISRILAHLLDPSQAHGQGATFLRLFLGLLQLPPADEASKAVRILTEPSLDSGNGRADICIDYTAQDRKMVHLLIENKPWAGDGHRQIARYAEHMQNRHGDAWKIIYMPPVEQNPREHAIPEQDLRRMQDAGRFFILPYQATNNDRSVLTWLDQCDQHCEADRPKRFIQEFKTYIQENIGNEGEQPMNAAEQSTSTIVLDFLQRRDEDIDIAIEVARSLTLLRHQMVQAIGEKITEAVINPLGEEWASEFNFSGVRWCGLKVFKDNWRKRRNQKNELKRPWIGFEFEEPNFRSPKFGVAFDRSVLDHSTGDTLSSEIKQNNRTLQLSNAWWAASSRSLGSIPGNWSSDEFLKFALRAQQDQSKEAKIVLGFAKEIVDLANAVAKILDEQN